MLERPPRNVEINLDHYCDGHVAYRVYRLTKDDSIFDVEILDVKTDAEAVNLIRLRRSTYPLELWERGRLVGRFDP